MSLTTDAARSLADGVDCTWATAWSWSSYSTLIADASGPTYLVGLYVTTSAISSEFEIELAVGTAGNEVSAGIVRCAQVSANNGSTFAFPLAHGPIAIHSRIAARARGSLNASVTCTVYLAYAVSLDADVTDNTNTAVLTATSLGANGVTISTGGAPAWTNGAWVELEASLPADSYLAAIAFYRNTAWEDVEIDLGLGAGGAESVLTTVRDGAGGYDHNGGLSIIRLPHIYRVEAGGRLAARVRSASTSLTSLISVLYYSGVVLPPTGTPQAFADNSGLLEIILERQLINWPAEQSVQRSYAVPCEQRRFQPNDEDEDN